MSSFDHDNGDHWLERAIKRAETGLSELAFARLAGGPTRAALWRACDELHTASEHVREAAIAYGIGDVR